MWSFVELLGNPVKLWAITSSADTVKYYLDKPGAAGSVAVLKISEEPHYVLATSVIDYYLADGVTLGSEFRVKDPRDQRLWIHFSEVIQGIVYSNYRSKND